MLAAPFLPTPEKMVTSEALDGVPILVLANKQDVEVSRSPWCAHRAVPSRCMPP